MRFTHSNLIVSMRLLIESNTMRFYNFSVECFSVFLYSYSHFRAVAFAVSLLRTGYI